jgi:hypothetical protein
MADIQDIYQAALVFSLPYTLAVMVLLILAILIIQCHRSFQRRRDWRRLGYNRLDSDAI